VNGTLIDALRYNGATQDIAAGISSCLAKNGENVPTANLPMGGRKHVGAGPATAAGEYITLGQNVSFGTIDGGAATFGNTNINGLLTLNSAPGTQTYMMLNAVPANPAFVGQAGAVNDLVQGTGPGDMAIRTGGRSILFSINSGAGWSARLAASGQFAIEAPGDGTAPLRLTAQDGGALLALNDATGRAAYASWSSGVFHLGTATFHDLFLVSGGAGRIRLQADGTTNFNGNAITGVGNLNAGGIGLTGGITAATFVGGSFSGNGAGLTNVAAASAVSASWVSGLNSNGYGTRTVSTGGPSGGADGDIHYQYV
jgi:hypothetical protein